MQKNVHSSERGYILLLVIVFTGVFLTMLGGIVAYAASYAKLQRNTIGSAQALTLAEAGLDKAVYELNADLSYAGESNTALGNGTITISVADLGGDTKRVTVTGYVPNSTSPIAQKTVKATISIDADIVSFKYGVQAGEGGVRLLNSSSVRGNLYSTGSVIGGNNYVRGEVISAGPTGLIRGIHATSSAYAHTIENSTIDKDAYYQSISGSTVIGTSYPGSADQPTTTLPISDEQIEAWEAQAEAGGTISSPCPYTISSSITIGPKKIDCDLEISGNNYTITLTGPLWVNGSIDIKNSPTITINSSAGNAGVAIVADNPSNRTTSSKIDLDNSMTVEGTGAATSHVLFVSQNNSGELGGSEVAINLDNSAHGQLLVYSGHGIISLANSVSIREVSAWRIEAKNTAEIVYSTGLANALFTAGPGASWAVQPGTFTIVP
jgi:hypothetical protein